MQDNMVLTPDQLEADATVPQCLDNQYVSTEIFTDMVKRGADYTDPAVKEARQQDARVEFRRSLVYSSQLVLNRAFLVNNPLVFENYLPGNADGLRAFARLVSRPAAPDGSDSSPQAIVPYLYKAASFDDDFGIDEDPTGRAALNALLDVVGHKVTSVRLGHTDDEDKRQTAQLERKFGSYFSGTLNQLIIGEDDASLNEMANELFGPRSGILQEAGASEAFRAQLRRLAADAFESVVSRTSYYKKWLVPGDTDRERAANLVRGVFRKPVGKDAFTLEMKKLIDLVYNTNLPDMLNRYTFTPLAMPSRLALQDFSVHGMAVSSAADQLLEDCMSLKNEINRIFMANAHKAMSLPELGKLTISDIADIRELEAWAAFSQAQQRILREPLKILDHLEGFNNAFGEFQHQLSRWYFKEHVREQRAERYANLVTVALEIAGKTMIALGFPGTHVGTILLREAAGSVLENAIPNRVKGLMVNLMVYVVDLQRQCLDRTRSYSIELIRMENEFTRDEVLDLMRRFTPNLQTESFDDSDATQLSDQSTSG